MNHTGFFFSIASLLMVALVSTAAAFSAHSPITQQRSFTFKEAAARVPTVLFASGDETADSSLQESESPSTVADETPKVAVKCPDCDLCDGSGRIVGGIGMVLDWWPVKAYRPCPTLIERGGKYVRSGQGLDEIAFGRDSTFQSDS